MREAHKDAWFDANEATRGYIKELEHSNLSLTMALERTEESHRKLEEKLAAAEKAAMQNGCDRNKAEFKLAVADAKIDELKQQVVDYETDWRKMRKYYDGAMEKMAIAIEALEDIAKGVCTTGRGCISGEPCNCSIDDAIEALEKIKR